MEERDAWEARGEAGEGWKGRGGRRKNARVHVLDEARWCLEWSVCQQISGLQIPTLSYASSFDFGATVVPLTYFGNYEG